MNDIPDSAAKEMVTDIFSDLQKKIAAIRPVLHEYVSNETLRQVDAETRDALGVPSLDQPLPADVDAEAMRLAEQAYDKLRVEFLSAENDYREGYGAKPPPKPDRSAFIKMFLLILAGHRKRAGAGQ